MGLKNEDKIALIGELKNLYELDEYSFAEKQESDYPVKSEMFRQYFTQLRYGAKPESAANELIKQLMIAIFELDIISEVNYENSFVDFTILTGKNRGNPLLLELKPFYSRSGKDRIIKKDLQYLLNKDQIQKYLRTKTHEYVILTNLEQAYLFNREALIDYKPFAELKFADILTEYLTYLNLWDTIRRVEDNIIKPDLDNEFFNSLKVWFNDMQSVKLITGKHSNEELIVLFLNKFIFIKTLEDYGLISYKYLQEEYNSYVEKWRPKGYNLVFKYFFSNIEDFFKIYYNTELFKADFWDFIEKSPANIENFRKIFELILGLDAWSMTYGKGLVHFNYRQINEDIFGKAYETWIAENRKDEGIYYTPAVITEYMANKIVDSLFDKDIELLIAEINNPDGAPNYAEIDLMLDRISSIKIIDPTSGSGSFLIKVLKRVYSKYKKIMSAVEGIVNYDHVNGLFEMPPFIKKFEEIFLKYNIAKSSKLKMVSTIILNHIFAADKDERALETAKTNLWKEAIKLDPDNYNYLTLAADKVHILPNLEMNFVKGDSLADIEFERQIEIITSECKNDIIRLYEIRKVYLADPFAPDIIEEALVIKEKIRERLKKEIEIIDDPLFFCLEFFYCYFNDSGEALPVDERGFSGIISNPPWEAVKPVKKEFAKINKGDMDVLHFTKWFDEKLKSDKEFTETWFRYVHFYEEYTRYLYSKYKHQSSGDPNLYKFFLERDFQIIKPGGDYCLLVPSGFQTDEGGNRLRENIIVENHLIELSSFENRGYFDNELNKNVKLFPDVDNRFKFSIVYAKKEKIDDNYSINAKFYLRHPEKLYNGNSVTYNIKKIKVFSPENLSIMEFRSEKDYDLCSKIIDGHKDFKQFNMPLRREFDMTNDSGLFHSFSELKNFKKEKFCRLYEGKMIYQFDANYAEARYFIKEDEARKKLTQKVMHRIKRDLELGKEQFEQIEFPKNLTLDYQTYRLVYRAIGRSTDEKTLISSIIPQNVFIGHSMNHIVNVSYYMEGNKLRENLSEPQGLVFVMSLFNSLTLNYYIRNKISANLTMNFIYELPIAEAGEEDRAKIIRLGFSLLYRKSNRADFEDLRTELGVEVDEETDLAQIRAELEVIIAKNLYGLDKSDWEYLTSTFVYGGGDTKAELDEIIRISHEIY